MFDEVVSRRNYIEMKNDNFIVDLNLVIFQYFNLFQFWFSLLCKVDKMDKQPHKLIQLQYNSIDIY